ncbi:DNA-directed RNA polymerase core subunit [Pichia kluyveri]|uniref:DNA-directed RNA polymerases I and III subunit RPAC2 n=1 Tax=Pichia kluyveri TaxID=36015 RepID=A0AAV5RAE4_PICKL|nr:DNA-directed RNA polymerase core subunit [Pichia kluyveri]
MADTESKPVIAPTNDIEMNEVNNEENLELAVDTSKIQLLPGATSDGFAASFQIIDEDHTLGNALRYMIMKNEDVEFCGYSIPHPSENKLNIRIQTYGKMTAVEAFHKGLEDLSNLCSHVEEVFSTKVANKDYSTEEP